MKQIFGTLIMLLILQQAFGQCVNCPGSTPPTGSASVLGEQAYANGNSAFAAGFQARAEQNGSIALGLYAKSTYSNAMAFGINVTAANSNSIVIGNGFAQLSPLINNVPNSLMIGFGSTKPTFFVGISPNSSSTGRVGIGNVTAPQAKLHIRADANEPATLRLEATGTSGDNIYSRMLFTPSHSIQAANNQNFTFSTQSTKHFVFQNGNVGIGIASPRGKLDVVGNAFIEGIVYTEEVIVEDASNWPDYVFESDYQLMGLDDLKKYIELNKHLPDTPKADDNGSVQNLKLGEMNGLLLKKNEELTLYILEQEERIRRLENALEQ